MNPETIRDMIAALAAEEESLDEAAKKIEVRVAQLRSARAALAPLVNEPVPQFEGNLADACRQILKTNSERSFSPKEMRFHLIAIGYDKKHDNLMAAIHAVLKRLAESDDVDSKLAKDGSGTRYFWTKKPAAPVKQTSLPITLDTAAAMAIMSDSYQHTLQQIVDAQKSGGLGEIMEQVKKLQEVPIIPAIQKEFDRLAKQADLASDMYSRLSGLPKVTADKKK